MKNDLTCAVVRDILPLYAEGLTSEETNIAVDNHLSTCAECTEFKNNLVSDNIINTDDIKEINYLKSVKRHNKHKIILAVIITVFIICAAAGYKAFFIGSPVEGIYGIDYSFTDNYDGTVTLNIEPPAHKVVNSWSAFVGNGEAEINASSVLPSPFFISTGYTETFNTDEVKEVYLCGTLIWKDSVIITDSARALLETKTPYIGDVSALGRVASRLNIYELCGNYSVELQTSEQPYGCTFCFENAYSEKSQYALNANMERSAIQLIALIDNLNVVKWRYTDTKGEELEFWVSTDVINDVLPMYFNSYNEKNGTEYEVLPDVKDYAADEVKLQQLINVLNYFY